MHVKKKNINYNEDFNEKNVFVLVIFNLCSFRFQTKMAVTKLKFHEMFVQFPLDVLEM